MVAIRECLWPYGSACGHKSDFFAIRECLVVIKEYLVAIRECLVAIRECLVAITECTLWT